MSQDKRNIDQLFRAKLRDYEATPPPSVWTHIVGELGTQAKIRHIIMLRRTGAAAAIVAALLAGWWLNQPDDPNQSNENVSNVQVPPKTEILNPTASTHPDYKTAQSGVPDSRISKSPKPGLTNSKSKLYRPSLTSIASFAPVTNFLNISNAKDAEGAKGHGLVDFEKEFLSYYRNDVKIIRQFSDWITSVNNSSKFKDTIRKGLISNTEFGRLNAGIISQTVRPSDEKKNSYFAGELNKESPDSRNRNWTVSAGLSPVTFTQRQGGSSITGQQTSYENSVTGSLLAGYKIGKKLVVKSGVILNHLKQVTRITEYPPAYSSDSPAFKTANVATTSGRVNLDKGVLIKSDVLFSSENIPSSGTRPELKQEFRYVEIPVEMVYKLIDRKFNVGVTGGVSTNILAGNKAGLYDNGQKINNGRTSNLRDITYSGAIGLEIGYDLNSKVTLTVEPHLKRFLNSVSSNKEIDFKPYQIDIMTGVTYSFD